LLLSTVCGCSRSAKVSKWRGLTLSTRSDGHTTLMHASVERSDGLSGTFDEAIEVEIALHRTTNLMHARNCLPGGGSGGGFGGSSDFVTVDTLLPGQQQLVVVAAPVAEAFSYSSRVQYRNVPFGGLRAGAGAVLGLGDNGAHAPPTTPSSLFAPHSVL